MEGRFLNFYITNKSMAGNLLICYMKNWEDGGIFFKKKLSKNASLLGSLDVGDVNFPLCHRP